MVKTFRRIAGSNLSEIDRYYATQYNAEGQFVPWGELYPRRFSFSEMDEKEAESPCRSYQWDDVLKSTAEIINRRISVNIPTKQLVGLCKLPRRSVVLSRTVFPVPSSGNLHIAHAWHKTYCLKPLSGETEFDYAWAGYSKYGKTMAEEVECVQDRTISTQDDATVGVDRLIEDSKMKIQRDINDLRLLEKAIPPEEALRIQ